MPFDIVVFGDLMIEILTRISELPKWGQDEKVEQLRVSPGGSAANTAAIAAKLGLSVMFIGQIGNDAFAPFLLEDLQQHGVNIQHVISEKGPTSLVVTMVDPKGERTFLSFRGNASKNTYGALPNLTLSEAGIVHISGYTFQTPPTRQTALELIEVARRSGFSLSIDPSFQFSCDVLRKYPHILKGLDYFFPNDVEAREITGQSNPVHAIEELHAYGIKNVILKLGEKGTIVSNQHDRINVPAYKHAEVVDTTGAGDAFAAGFLLATRSGFSLEEAAKTGNAVASIIISTLGAHTAAPTILELIEFSSKQGDFLLTKLLSRLVEKNKTGGD
jgi:sugar/nucleoside kinase (ribokinase family)